MSNSYYTFFKKHCGVPLFLFIVGIGFGHFIDKNYILKDSHIEVRQNSKNFTFINPLLQCDMDEDVILESKQQPHKAVLMSIIDSEEKKGNVNHVSVYYRDLNNGPWLGINEKELFFPASLMKLPVLMQLFHDSENDPSLLSKKIKIASPLETYSHQFYKPEKAIEENKIYTVSELMEYMIKYSDNNALTYLLNETSPQELKNLFKDLYIETPKNDVEDYIRVKDYATFFRVLYNSSYLHSENSEKILKLLSETKFDKGITRYLPETITVAHKFGEQTSPDVNKTQLHDCGIVYYPQHPYLLCVMTRGDNIEKMANTIGLISQSVYEQINN